MRRTANRKSALLRTVFHNCSHFFKYAQKNKHSVV